MDPTLTDKHYNLLLLRRLYVLPPDLPVSMAEALPEVRGFAGCLVHPLVVGSLGRCLTRREADAVLRCAPLTLAEAAAALKECRPGWPHGSSVACTWQDGRQVCALTQLASYAIRWSI